MRKSISLLLALTAALAAAPALAADKDSVTIGMALEPPTLDPTTGAAAAISEITHYNVFEGLTKLDDNFNVTPLLAEKWTFSPDLKTLTLTLRQGLKFQDGESFSSKDVKYSFERAAAKDVGYLDCPVLGRPQGCGKWTLPTGGDEWHLEKVRPILENLAARIVPVGPSGHGNVVKLLNNMMFGAINAITAEVFALSAKLGMQPKVLFNTIADSGAATVSNLFRELGPKILDDEFSPLFSIDNLHKDMRLGIEMAHKVDAGFLVSEANQRLNTMAREAEFGAEDTAAAVKICRRMLNR